MIKTILIFVFIAVSMILLLPFGLIALVFYFLGLRNIMKMAMYKIAQGWGRAILAISGCKTIVTGRENIPKKNGVCFVSNHSGYFDIVLMLAYCGRPVGFVAKKELALVPFLNAWIFLLGGLFIDRKNPRKASRTIFKGANKIKAGGGMIIFPEGHRSKGRGLLPFHPGSLKLATMAEAAIIPVFLEGAYEFYEKNKRVTKTTFKIAFCKPIDTGSIPSTDRKLILTNRIYDVIKEKMESSVQA